MRLAQKPTARLQMFRIPKIGPFIRIATMMRRCGCNNSRLVPLRSTSSQHS